ncbi:MAG TPA: hypothetical protein VFC94_00360, partial [Bacteroidaceae bacterium]|nr:hypothetical protein [Bacteroidaceae bacterium]
SDAFTGWDLEYSAGNAFTGTNYGYAVASDETPTVNSYLGLDWNTALTLDQAIVNLPAGVYNLGAGIGTATVNEGTILYASQFDEEGDSVRITSDPWITGGATWTGPGTNQYLRFEALGDTVHVGINLVATTDWSFVDNFALEMIDKLADFDYAAAAAQASIDLDAAIESRIDAVSGETSVQYFNLNGVEISSPRAGVNIRVTVGADGSRKVEKILVK